MRRALLFVAVAAASAGCGTSQVSGIDAGQLPPIEPPAVRCSATGHECTCSPTDASAASATCDRSVVADASCCQGLDYPFAGSCTCGAFSCDDGGVGVSSCSTPTPTNAVDAGCDPATCNGSACAGGYCCTSSCQGGVCQPTCS